VDIGIRDRAVRALAPALRDGPDEERDERLATAGDPMQALQPAPEAVDIS